MNKVILLGRLCHDPEIKYVGEKNLAVTRFTLAIDRNYKNEKGEYDTDFISCELWNRQAEIFNQYMTKGRLIYVEGKIKVDKYLAASGKSKRNISINCDSFRFIDFKQNNKDGNTFNSEKIFTDEISSSEISENEIPF